MSKNKLRSMTTDERRSYAAQVKEVRESQKMTQQELAEAAGVTRQTISNLERGTIPQTDILLRVCGVLGIEVDDDQTLSDDTKIWLGVIGGILEMTPQPHRGRAGQAAVNLIAKEFAESQATKTTDPSTE